jgi:Rad3-related DNA helicase
MVSRELEKECVVVFDEAHNIDNVCIEVGRRLGCGGARVGTIRTRTRVPTCVPTPP